MLHFADQNLIFIEVPKTATSSVVAECISRSPNLTRNSLYKDGRIVASTVTHVTAYSVSCMLCSASIDDQKLFAFFRDPVDVLRSK